LQLSPAATRRLLIAVVLLVAATRFAAFSRSLWDWDEAQFSAALRHYDVAAHHPHPPGFPLFIALGKLARLVIGDDFRALRAVTLLFSMLVFPAMFALMRALRRDVVTSAIGAVFFAFMPNVWFYGGTAFSDVAAIVLILAASAALFDDRYWIGGNVLLALAIAVRPQNALIAIVPWLRAARRRTLRSLLGGAATAIAIAAAFYSWPTAATGWTRYRAALADHARFIAAHDTWRCPARHFALDPLRAPKITAALIVLSLAGLARARRDAIVPLAMFLPPLLFALFMLDPNSVTRFSISYVPLLAILAAEGTAIAARAPLQIALAALVVAAMIAWSVPALNEVRRNDSPPARAAEWIRSNVDPRGATIFSPHDMAAFAGDLLPEYRRVEVPDDFSALDVADSRNSWLLFEGTPIETGAVTFTRPRGRLWQIARRRYFETAVIPVAALPKFASGWHDAEDGWRWMKGESMTMLPPVRGRAVLELEWRVPRDAEPREPVATFALNGRVIERVVCAHAAMRRAWIVEAQPAANELRISVDASVTPSKIGRGGDSRQLGLRLDKIGWKPAP
jgi:hypothetical protein